MPDTTFIVKRTGAHEGDTVPVKLRSMGFGRLIEMANGLEGFEEHDEDRLEDLIDFLMCEHPDYSEHPLAQ